ncbi:MAG: glycosyltransferase, partial [Bacteroidetes bacterium]|nr:glycosyltransferase [Bacteroidota bacterium]
MKRVIVSVTNDLSTDQRVHKTCMVLHEMGFDVTLVGRKRKSSLPLAKREYKTKRLWMIFDKGPLFYIEFTKRLFLFLLFKKADLLVSNDLDTLLPNFLIKKLKSSSLVYDSHEYFCGVPELENRPFVRNIWKTIEKWIFPKLQNVFTVNESIADLFKKEYGVDVKVVRNIPAKIENSITKTREELGLPLDKKIIILQGAGINIHRGAEEAVESMQFIKNAVLYIIGSGDVLNILKNMVIDLQLEEKVKFISKLPFDQLFQYTKNADLGLTLDKDTNINYKFSLPNKLFDYIQAGVPIIASQLVEIQKIIEKYNIGAIIENHKPTTISKTINQALFDDKN